MVWPALGTGDAHAHRCSVTEWQVLRHDGDETHDSSKHDGDDTLDSRKQHAPMGKSKLMTAPTLGMSSPRAATSVAIRMGAFPCVRGGRGWGPCWVERWALSTLEG